MKLKCLLQKVVTADFVSTCNLSLSHSVHEVRHDAGLCEARPQRPGLGVVSSRRCGDRRVRLFFDVIEVKVRRGIQRYLGSLILCVHHAADRQLKERSQVK